MFTEILPFIVTISLSILTFVIVGYRYRRGDYNRDPKNQ